jgi:two-component system, sensor histidine kinase and response regulator
MGDKAVDLDELAERLGGDLEAVAELIDIFLEDGPALVQEVHAAGDDLQRVRRAAHTLKGACGNMAAERMCTIAARLQDLAGAGDLAGAAGEVRALADEMARVVVELEAARASLAPRRLAS